MTNKDLLQAMGNIDPKLIADAAPDIPRKTDKALRAGKTRKPWIKYAAAAAACLVAVGGFGVGYKIINSRPVSVFDIAAEKKMLLAAAIYPEMPRYPKVDNKKKVDDKKAGEKWSDAVKALRDQPEGYQDGFDVFFLNSTRAFLSDAGTENMIYSPLSLYMALGMSAEITDGDTRRQILDALAQSDIDTLRAHAKSIWQANYMDDGMAKCVLATSLWTNNNIAYDQATVGRLADNYYSSVFTGDPSSEEYNKLLQAWINEQTDGLLTDYASDIEMTPETVLTLASTVNYSGKWNSEFSKKLTKKGTFHSPDGDVQCDFMNEERITTLFWGDKFSAISMDLENNGSMRLILPDEGISVEELLNDDEVFGFMTYIGGIDKYPNSKRVTVNMSIPKFDVSSEIDLRDGLGKLGITDLFDPQRSDFSPLTESADNIANIALSKAEQDTRVMIDEEGCKASALTVIEFNFMGFQTMEDRVDLVLDRPFVFEIMSDTGLPLFVGIVNDPDQPV